MQDNKWGEDYALFLTAESTNPPQHLRDKIFDRVARDLEPKMSRVLVKFILFQVLAGILTLTLCPQFNLGAGHGMMHFFMQFGVWACALFCGTVFMGSSTLLACVLLKSTEYQVLLKHDGRALVLALSVSLGVMMLMGGEFDQGRVFLLFWIFACLVVGKLGIRALSFLRAKNSYFA